ncbi:MAG: SDR family NAD(P)-dependent oxidoreductase, partial [Gammaproteobacteria bacterium]|nr:SDR family NAD(P)-dependent oxidoreductase [Gammaproteobacteria bacterium]
MMRDLTDKVAWITGGGTGIGEAGAIALAEAGMNVVLSGRREEPLRAVADAIGERAWVKPLDVADKDAVNQVASDLLERYGRCDVMVNNAGLNVLNRHWHHVTLDDYDLVIRVVLDGAFYCSKAVLPTMIEQQDGLIINVSSWAGKYTNMMTGPAYNAAKHAMNSMTESLNMEAGIHGIRACAICPGEVNTVVMEKRPVPVPDEDRAKMVQSEDCGEIIAFIARLPKHVCINELTVSPTWNRIYADAAQKIQV